MLSRKVKASLTGIALPVLFFFVQFYPGHVYAQTLGLWGFSGSTVGSAGSYNTVSVADFGPAITTKGYSGSVYYGENGWPAGGMNPAYYMQFSLVPVAGNALNILSLVLIMRRSNTGSPAGSGPTKFSIRSSVDNYTSDLLTGNLTDAPVSYLVTPPAGFDRLASSVSFRVYGFNATTSAGGLSRLVFDNILVTGSNIILPFGRTAIAARMENGMVDITSTLENRDPDNIYTIERSSDAVNFSAIHTLNNPVGGGRSISVYQDNLIVGFSKKLYYRIRVQGPGGTQYSSVVMVTVSEAASAFSLSLQGNTMIIRSGIRGNGIFHLFSAAGVCVLKKQLITDGASRIAVGGLSGGIYYGSLSGGGGRQTAAIYIP
jgi:hypothetical protein